MEQAFSVPTGAQSFVQLCNTIAWSNARPTVTTAPSLTERINVRDDGIDAEWDFEPGDWAFTEDPLIGRGWTVYQYKQRSVVAQGRKATVSQLIRDTGGALRDLIRRTDKRPTKYVFFTNVDLSHRQKPDLRRAIRTGCPRGQTVRVEILGAAELAALLNDLPHVRAAFFGTPALVAWPQAWSEHVRESHLRTEVPLAGREEELGLLCTWLRDAKVRAVLLIGPPGIGKQRLLLEATRSESLVTVVAPDPLALTSSRIRSLVSRGRETIAIVETEDRSQIERFVSEAKRLDGFRVLVATSSPRNLPGGGFGQDDRTRLAELDPISTAASRELLQSSEANLDYSLESWVLEHCRGNPEMMVLAAHLGPDLRKSDDFLEELAAACERDVDRDLGPAALDALRALSIFDPIVGLSKGGGDLSVACRLAGDEVNESQLSRLRSPLSRAGYLRCREDIARVVPPLLANHLARQALAARRAELLAIWCDLGSASRTRLARRLGQLPAMKDFWAPEMAEGGFLSDFARALQEPELLLAAAASVPEDVAALLAREVQSLSPGELRRIVGRQRRALIQVLEELLFRRTSSRDALETIGWLAMGENEDFSNNSTGIFAESFYPLHHQLPLPLNERFEVLRTLAAPEAPAEAKMVAVAGIKAAVGRGGGTLLRPSVGATPFDARPRMLWEDVYDYLDDLAGLLLELYESESPEVGKSAAKALPDFLSHCVIHSGREQAVKRLERLVDVAQEDSRIEVSDLIGSLQFARSRVRDSCEEVEQAELKQKLETVGAQLDGMIELIDQSAFSTRVRRWIGGWAWSDSAADDRADEEAIRDLARAATEDPEILDPNTFEWLNTESAQRSTEFFWELGRADEQCDWLDRLRETQGTGRASQNLAAYVGGVSARSPAQADRMLDILEQDARVGSAALIGAIQGAPARPGGVDRVLRAVGAEPIGGRITALRGWGWLADLEPEDFARLLDELAGPDLENAAAVLSAVGFWLRRKRPLTAAVLAVCWRCLATSKRVRGQEEWHFDQVASACAEVDPEGAFRLLEDLLERDDSCGWNPFGIRDRSEFWNRLRAIDSRRAVSVALNAPLDRFALRGVIDPAVDHDALVESAKASEDQAAHVVSLARADSSGFWLLGMMVAGMYPKSESVSQALSRAVYTTSGATRGPYSAFLARRKRQVEWLLSQNIADEGARRWLRALDKDLKTTVSELEKQEALDEAAFGDDL